MRHFTPRYLVRHLAGCVIGLVALTVMIFEKYGYIAIVFSYLVLASYPIFFMFLRYTLIRRIASPRQVVIALISGFLVFLSSRILWPLQRVVEHHWMPLLVAVLVASLWSGLYYLKEYLSEHPVIRRWFFYGKGNSARWAGVRTFWRLWLASTLSRRNRRLFMGRTLPEDSLAPCDIYLSDTSHMITLGMTGSGKSSTVLFNNLTEYQGNIFTLDPKGELAEYAYGKRKGTDYVLDPFNVTGSKKGNIRRIDYNPLADIDINAPDVMRYLSGVSAACVVDEGKEDSFWTDNARTIIEGLIAFALATQKPERHNFPYIHDLFVSVANEDGGIVNADKFERLLDNMQRCHVAGGVAIKAVRILRDAGDREFGTLSNTVQRGLKWAIDPAMRQHLKPSNPWGERFSLRKLVEERCSVYIVLPFDYIKPELQARYMRVMVAMLTSIMQSAQKKPKTPVLFLLDEFPALGSFPLIESAFAELRGAGAKFWIFVQNMGQLEKLYNKGMDTFLTNANIQVLPTNSDKTIEWAHKRLGRYTHHKRKGWFGKIFDSEETELMTLREVRDFLRLGDGHQIVFPAETSPLKLNTVFFKDFIPHYKRNV